MKAYAQLDAAGLCVGVSELAGEVNAPHMIEIENAESIYLGRKWTGAAWTDAPAVVPTEKELAAAALLTIDRETGMTRTLREALIAIAGKVGADVTFLATKEAAAVAARAKLK